MTESAESPIFNRTGNFVRFEQRGAKMTFSSEVSDEDYYDWLDGIAAQIHSLVPGSEIIEKEGARLEPRFNTGVYYDTDAFDLLGADVVLRTTCNPKTHAFCAFKIGESQAGIRSDHRYIFDGEEKLTIQYAPTSSVSEMVVKTLLARTDIDQPGKYLIEHTGVRPSDLLPAVCLAQYRRTFYVLLDKADALRCSLDRVNVINLRPADAFLRYAHFSEIELPIYPRISPSIASDPRTSKLIDVLAESLTDRYNVAQVGYSKYRRGASALGINFQPRLRAES